MPAQRPSGTRNETVECEHCGEHYALIYKRCPFCDGKPNRRNDDQTIIFRRPTQQEINAHAREEAMRRTRRPQQEDEYDSLPRQSRRPAPEPEDEYEDEPMRRFVSQRNDRDLDSKLHSYPIYGEDEDDYEDDDDYDRPSGGRRLVNTPRSGGSRRRGPSILRILLNTFFVAIIAAAIYIVVIIVTPFLKDSRPAPTPSTSPAVTHTVPPAPTSTSSPSPEPSFSPEPSVSPMPSGSVEPQPTAPSAVPSGQTATGFSITNNAGKRLQDITLNAQEPTFRFVIAFSPSGTTGSITWSSSKPEIVSVDQSGNVTAVSKGVATITATMAGGYAQSCIVRSTVGDAAPSPSPSASPSPSPSNSPSGAPLSFNISGGNDFTLSGVGDSWPLKVNNAVGTPTWSVKDSSIATVDANGRVTAVAKGITVVTATVDGKTLECTVRVIVP